MFRLSCLIACVSIVLYGCHHADAAPSSTSVAAKSTQPDDPMVVEREGVHQGAYLLGQAAVDLQTAVNAAKKAKSVVKNADLKAALNDVLQSLDDAGASIADFTAEPPDVNGFRADFANQDERRLNAINAANDALHNLDDIGDSLDEFTNGPTADLLDDLGTALDAAGDNLTEAIKALGGKVENDDTEDVTPQGASKSPAAKPDL